MYSHVDGKSDKAFMGSLHFPTLSILYKWIGDEIAFEIKQGNLRMEEVKKTKTKRAAAAFEVKHEELEKALVILGTLLLVAGLKKHVFTSLFEQWRVLAFLLLNLLLLSIFFMSLRSGDSGNLCNDTHRIQTANKKKKQQKKKRCHCSVVVVEEEVHHTSSCTRSSGTSVRDATLEDEDSYGEGEANPDPRLSKEELNAKVEAFIATFRHQLALDAKGMMRSRSHYYASSQGSNSFSN